MLVVDAPQFGKVTPMKPPVSWSWSAASRSGSWLLAVAAPR